MLQSALVFTGHASYISTLDISEEKEPLPFMDDGLTRQLHSELTAVISEAKTNKSVDSVYLSISIRSQQSPALLSALLIVQLLLVAATQHVLQWSKLLAMRFSHKFLSSSVLTWRDIFLGFFFKKIGGGHWPTQIIITQFVCKKLCLFQNMMLCWLAATSLRVG